MKPLRPLSAVLGLLLVVTVVAAVPGARRADGAPGDTSIFVVGDSVLLGAAPQIEEALAGYTVQIDAVESRSALESPAILAGRTDDVVVISIGHNDGPAGFGSRIDEIMAGLGNVDHVIWLTQQEFRSDRPSMNAELRAAQRRHATLEVLDWNAIVASTPNANWADGLHLRPEGGDAMAAAVAAAVEDALVVSPPELLATGATWSVAGVAAVTAAG
ncbi:MAG: hypothetical protein R3A49_03965 [Acidimicrobiia bacterium]